MKSPSQLHKAAIWYAHHGYQIFPLKPGTKVPFVKDWEHTATSDATQIEQWWSRNPNYNIGLACGPSGLVVLDFDTYKSGVNTDILFDDDELVNCVISHTARGGTHLWFRQPEGVTLTNARGSLPKDVDVRGKGGYIVAPPSRLAEGGQYTFRPGHKPIDVEPPALPGPILPLLLPEPRPLRTRGEELRSGGRAPLTEASEQEIADALRYIPTRMAYDEWCAILMAVHSELPDERGIQLCEAWSPGYKGEIAKKFASVRKSGTTIATLFHLAKAHGYQIPRRMAAPDESVRTQLFSCRRWVWSAPFTHTLKQRGVRRCAELISILDALIVLGHERGTTRVSITHRTLADICDIAPMTAWRRLDKLKETNLITLEKGESGPTIVELSLLINNACASDTHSTMEECVSLTHEEMEWQAAHRTDDAFTSYPYWSAVKRRGGVSPLMASLGATGWQLWPHLRRGGTLAELVEASGLGISAIRHALRKFMSNSLVDEAPIDREGLYVLNPSAEKRMDEIRPHLVTFGVGQMRAGRNFADSADYASYRLRRRKHMETKDIIWWENMRAENDRKAGIYFNWLKEQGFDPCMKVGRERKVRARNRNDYGEEWRTWGRPLFDSYNALEGLDHDRRVHLLTVANVGPDASEKIYRRARSEMSERVDMMHIMARKRVEYERRDMTDYYEEPQAELVEQLAFDLMAVSYE
jgi:hypothetical protein